MIPTNEPAAVIRAYLADCSPTRIEPLSSAGGMSGAQFWRIESPRGTLVLRRWPTEHPTPERLSLIHAVLFHAAQRGIAFLALPIRTTNGESFVRHVGHLWELSRWMPGTADYERSPTIKKLQAAMSALARFHVAVRELQPVTIQRVESATAIPRRLERLLELSSSGANELSQAITNAVWPELGPLAHRFIATLPICLPRAMSQLFPIANSSLPLQLCLRDIWHDHVLFTGDEVTGMIDFGGVDFDTPATDIARLLGSLVGDDAAGWQCGLDAYSEVRPLTTRETRAAKALDASGMIVAGCNWLRWIYIDGRQFEDPSQVMERFRKIVARCELDVGS